VDNDDGNSLTPINARTGKPGHPIPVEDPYNLYFTPDGRFAIVVAERLQRLDGRMIEIDLQSQQIVRTLVLNNGASSPQDVKLSPDGRTIYTADQENAGLWEIDASTFGVIGFLRTGAGAHGLYPSRNAEFMYVSTARRARSRSSASGRDV
jgi:DNA-binding beta-propeller fold protein YncE